MTMHAPGDLTLSHFLPFPDNRSKAYPLVDNPIPTVALVLIYLSIVMVIGPLWMRDRKPFNLKNTLIYYNAFQVVLSGYMFYEVGVLIVPWITELPAIGESGFYWTRTKDKDEANNNNNNNLMASNYDFAAPHVRLAVQVQPQVPINWLQWRWSCTKGECFVLLSLQWRLHLIVLWEEEEDVFMIVFSDVS